MIAHDVGPLPKEVTDTNTLDTKASIPLVKLLEMAQQAALGNAETEAKAKAYDELVGRLHAKENHPDYMYNRTETGRKSDQDASPPEGEGWVINVHKGDQGWERFDYTEETYWMRLKEEAKKDPIYPWDLKPVMYPKVKRDQLLDMVRAVTNAGYMPRLFIDTTKSSYDRPSYNSKPTYTNGSLIAALNDMHCSGFLAYERDAAPDKTNPFWSRKPDTDWAEQRKDIYAGLYLPKLRVLINLTTEEVMVAALNDHGFLGSWTEWTDTMSLHVGADLAEQINTYL